jgi:hypothetical protein
MTCCVFERGMMAGGAAGAEEIDKVASCVRTGILAEAGATREDEVGEVKLTLIPAAVAAEEFIREAGEVG